MEGDPAPLRHPGREDPLAQGPLLPHAAARPSHALFPLPVFLPAWHPGRQDGIHLPFPPGVLVPADRGYPSGRTDEGTLTPRPPLPSPPTSLAGRGGESMSRILGLSAYHADASAAAVA